MRRTTLIRLGVGAGVTAFLGLTTVACVDLFHDTDLVDGCDTDAASSACHGTDGGKTDAARDATANDAAGDGAPPADSGPTLVIGPGDPLCTADATMAATRVSHACAFLSACAGSFGVDAPSACITQARMVYDCNVAPQRPTIGAAGTFWRCVANATTCDGILDCLQPGGPAQCSPSAHDYEACEDPGDPSGNGASRIACGTMSDTLGIENCSASGRTCVGSSNTCGVATSSECLTGCIGPVLHSCDDAGVDQGVDCSNFGAGTCVSTPTAGAIGCTAVAAADAGTCTPTSDVTCDDNGVAHGCPSGVPETVNCAALTGAAPTAAACTVPSDTGGNVWDVSRACTVGTDCTGESCGAGGVISACVLGHTAQLDCSVAGVSSCLTTNVAGEGDHAACGTP
jgi:hypothetical protein